jgi:hypothetical protein
MRSISLRATVRTQRESISVQAGISELGKAWDGCRCGGEPVLFFFMLGITFGGRKPFCPDGRGTATENANKRIGVTILREMIRAGDYD